MRYIGPHVSIRGSVALSVGRAYYLRASGFAIFTKNQRTWSASPLRKDDAEVFRETMKDLGYPPESVLPHAGYLINPATPDEELRKKSLALFIDEARRTEELGLRVLNIHPGAYREGDVADGIRRAAAMIDQVLSEVPGIRIAVENTAGSGTILGSRFEELDALLSASSCRDRIGFTLDTAHLCGAGYDVRNDPDGILGKFVSAFGREKLYGMHLNDSKVPLGSAKDRHESLGKGCIGIEAFIAIVRNSATDGIPLILETPDESAWADEISLLRKASED